MAIAALHKISPVKTMVACTYQAVSGAGKHGLDELENQILKVSCTCVRVPVARSHSISATIRTERKISVCEAEKSPQQMPYKFFNYSLGNRFS